jgi:NADH:ubiquinone oxidoreductase subunit C
MNAEQARREVGGVWEERRDGWWLAVPANLVPQVAAAMLRAEARFVTILAMPENDGLRVSWHWDVGGVLLSVAAHLSEGMLVPSIMDTYPGADWAERETRDYYAVAFEGRPDTPTLMLRDGDKPGVLLCKSGEKL